MEYKLTRDGGIRLKAYNHSNDMYRYYKNSLYRQGVGIMFRRDFWNLYDLFRIRRKKPSPPVEVIQEMAEVVSD